MTTRPDLGMFLLSHQALRRDADRVAAAVRRLDVDSPAEAAALADAYGVFERMLVMHHRAEDDLVWPALRERRPELHRILDELEADHVVVDVWLGAIRRELDALSSDANVSTVDRVAAHSRLVEATSALPGRLGTHLDREEAVIVPIVLDVLTAADWEDLDSRRKAALTPEEGALSLAWVLSALPAGAREVVASEKLPPAVVAMWREQWAPAYEARVAPLVAAVAAA